MRYRSSALATSSAALPPADPPPIDSRTASRPLGRSRSTEERVAQLFTDQFKLRLGDVKPPLSGDQEKQIHEYLQLNAAAYLEPMEAELFYRSRLSREDLERSLRLQDRANMDAWRFIREFVLTPRQAESIDK